MIANTDIAVQARAQIALRHSGFFSHWKGPYGAVPVQFLGELKTGEFVYFRARGRKLSMQIAASQGDWEESRYLANFEEPYDAPNAEPNAQPNSETEDPFGAGLCPADRCATQILTWLKLYQSVTKKA